MSEHPRGKLRESEKSNPNIKLKAIFFLKKKQRVMNEHLVKNIIMNAKINPKVVMDLSLMKISKLKKCQPKLTKTCFMDEEKSSLLMKIPVRDPSLVTQYLKRHSVSSDQHIKNKCHSVKVFT